MADNTAALMALDRQSGGALAPFTTEVDLGPLRGPMLEFLTRLRQALPWAPEGLEYTAMQVMALGAFPRLRSFVAGARPGWLADEGRYQAWRAMITGPYKRIDLAFLAQNSTAAAAATTDAARNVAFWDNVAKYSGADALEKAWADFWSAIEDLKAQRAAAKTSLSVAQEVLAQYGTKVPADLSAQTTALTAQFNALTERAKAVLAPIPTAQQAAGLGAAPLVIAGVAGGVLVTVTGGVWAVAREFSAVQLNAANNAQALLRFRETADQQAYEQGKLTEEQLMARRGQNAKDAQRIVDSQGAAALGAGLGKAAAGLAAVAAVALGGFLLFNHLRKKPA